MSEVEPPCLAAQLNAIDIGSLELMHRAINKLVESFELYPNDPSSLALDDFKACLEYIPVFVDDPAMMLVNQQAARFDTYEEATKWFAQLQKLPDSASDDRRRDILLAFETYLEERLERDIQAFHRRFKDYTVHVTDEGRIVVGKYD
jgi:hypothetical protein